MKRNRSSRTHAFGILIILFAWLSLPQAALCFYNPTTGRWLSRDPVSEAGWRLQGHHVQSGTQTEENIPYIFVQNNAVNYLDAIGLYKCCCNGHRIDGTPVEILKICEGKAPGGPYDHSWIEADGYSAGFIPREDQSGVWQVPGQVRIPESPSYVNGEKHCFSVKVSPCLLNIQSAKLRLFNAIWASYQNPPMYNWLSYNCYDWVHDMQGKMWGGTWGWNAHGECGNDPHKFE